MTDAETRNYLDRVEKTAEYLKKNLAQKPEIGIMTGTGLGGTADLIKVEFETPYSDIPDFPVSTVKSHAGRLVCGSLRGRPALVMQGRFHLYEGYSPGMVAFPVRVMQALGVHTLIVTNAAGGLNPEFCAGDIMAITDHINLTGENPLVGPNNDDWGVRFPDMSAVYDPGLISLAEKAARKNNVSIKRGFYAGLKGPSLETPAETRFIRQIGADAVGLSTVQEVIAAVHAGMRILGLSTITNINDPEHPAPATVDQIIEVAEKAAPLLGKIITDAAKEL
ncbi:MAG: purine-nucleoside phosphorylase [Desulfobacteraceae bacterium]|nr:purine-nucleoside phosphorylase [Desulfobacteraceae bacterium]